MQRTLLLVVTCTLALFAAASAAPAQNLITNPSFSDGVNQPTGWTDARADDGSSALRSVRDTSEFVSAPASLRIESANATINGNSNSAIRQPAPGWYRVAGHLKSRNMRAGGISLVLFGEAGKQLGWVEVAFISGDSPWTQFDLLTTIPEGVQTAVFMAFGEFQPNSAFWVDDVSFTAAPVPTDRLAVFDFLGGTNFRASYGSWSQGRTATREGLVINARVDGGASLNRHFAADAIGSFVPVMHLKVLPDNTAKTLQLTLKGDERDRVYQFDLPAATDQFVSILARDFVPLHNAHENPGAFKKVTDARLTARANSDAKVAVVIQAVELVAPGQPVAMPQREPVTQD